MIYEIKPTILTSSQGTFYHKRSSHITMMKEGSNTARLTYLYVENQGAHIGTALLLCACLWAQQQDLTEISGTFWPSQGSETSDRFFYANRGIAIKSNGEISGITSTTIQLCQDSLSQYDINCKLI